MKRTLLAALSFLVATSLGAQITDDATIGKILAGRIASGGGVGMVVGVIDSYGTRVVSLGTVSKTDARRVDANTVFEIGAITKPFTALLLAEMIERVSAGSHLHCAVMLLPRGGVTPCRATVARNRKTKT